eukprot:1365033-Amorphochlora_amoeboformis.AAC.1
MYLTYLGLTGVTPATRASPVYVYALHVHVPDVLDVQYVVDPRRPQDHVQIIARPKKFANSKNLSARSSYQGHRNGWRFRNE